MDWLYLNAGLLGACLFIWILEKVDDYHRRKWLEQCRKTHEEFGPMDLRVWSEAVMREAEGSH